MNKKLQFILFLLVCVILMSSCQNGRDKHTPIATYVMENDSEVSAPYISLYCKDGKNYFQFVPCIVSSYIAVGEYQISGSFLVLKSFDGNVYQFIIDENKLVLQGKMSSELIKFEGFPFASNGSIFVLSE